MKNKKIIRLTESELHNFLNNCLRRIIKEDVLGDNWHEADDESAYNNYEPFESQENDEELPFGNDHDWSTEGEKPMDPTEKYAMWDNDPEKEMAIHNPFDFQEPSDNELYNYGNW